MRLLAGNACFADQSSNSTIAAWSNRSDALSRGTVCFDCSSHHLLLFPFGQVQDSGQSALIVHGSFTSEPPQTTPMTKDSHIEQTQSEHNFKISLFTSRHPF